LLNKEWFLEKINTFLKEDESNKMKGVEGILIFEPNVLVGLVSGNDPIFEEKYKRVIGSFHLTPVEAYTKYCKKKKIEYSTENLSVVAFILPINNRTKKENFEYSKEWPSERWAHIRLFGEEANIKLQKLLLSELNKEGINAVAPITENFLFRIHKKHENGVWASTWSHRHMCFAAGLGAFGLSDGFINGKGIAMRCGSIVIDYKFDKEEYTSNQRPSDPYEYCGNCGSCIKRCPADEISLEKRHDKQKCSEKVYSSIPYIKKNYNITIWACGLCQVGVPCENGIPPKT